MITQAWPRRLARGGFEFRDALSSAVFVEFPLTLIFMHDGSTATACPCSCLGISPPRWSGTSLYLLDLGRNDAGIKKG